MSDYTKGPWHVVPKDAPLTGEGIVCELDELTIRPTDGVALGYAEDDAALIAAVPEMLDALEAMADLYDTDEGCRSLPQYIAARAIIAKSRGQA